MSLPEASSESPASPLVMVAIAVFMLVAGAVLAVNAYGDYQAQKDIVENSVEVDAAVVDNDIRAHSSGSPDNIETADDDDETEWRLSIEFSYEYQGQQYTSDNFDLTGDTSRDYDSRSEAERAYSSYVGDDGETTAYVNPDEPGEAYLESGVPTVTYLTLIFAVFLIIAAPITVAYQGMRVMRDD